MPAFLDDRFHEHDKVEALEDNPREWMAAISVWTVANSYCKGNKTGGRITLRRLRKVTPLSERVLKDAASALCRVGLWHADGENAWVFHDWDQWSGKHEENVETKREKARKRQQRRRDKERAQETDVTRDKRDSHGVTGVTVTNVTQDRSHLSNPTSPSRLNPPTPRGGDVTEPEFGSGSAPPEFEAPSDPEAVLWSKHDPARATEYLQPLWTAWGRGRPSPGFTAQQRLSEKLQATLGDLSPEKRARAFPAIVRWCRKKWQPRDKIRLLLNGDLGEALDGRSDGPVPVSDDHVDGDQKW